MDTQKQSQSQDPAPQEEQQWSLKRLMPLAYTCDDEGELQCEACHKWMHAREQRPYYRLHIIRAGGLLETFQRVGQPGGYILCPTCAQKHIMAWLGVAIPRFSAMDAGFRSAKGWRTTNEEGGTVTQRLEVDG